MKRGSTRSINKKREGDTKEILCRPQTSFFETIDEQRAIVLAQIAKVRIYIVRAWPYAPKLSKRMFSGGTPRLSSRFSTDWVIIGGPHIR